MGPSYKGTQLLMAMLLILLPVHPFCLAPAAVSPPPHRPSCLLQKSPPSFSSLHAVVGGDLPPGGPPRQPPGDRPDWDSGDSDPDPDEEPSLVSSPSSKKGGLLKQLMENTGPMVQFMPRRIPALFQAIARSGNLVLLKGLLSQFPQVIRLCSLLGSDLLYLHSMAATAGAATIGYNVWVRRPLVGGKVVIFPITWNGIFMTVNLWQVNKLLRQRRPIDFTHDELDVFETSFSSRMTPRQFHSLLRDAGGRFRRIQAGTKLTAEGKRVGELFFLVDGECSVCIGDDQIEGNIKPRSFVSRGERGGGGEKALPLSKPKRSSEASARKKARPERPPLTRGRKSP